MNSDKEEHKLAPSNYKPEWCNAKSIVACSQWIKDKPELYVCRGCPYLKEEYQAKAIGRFR